MAGSAGSEAARGIAAMIQLQRVRRPGDRLEPHSRVMMSDPLALVGAKLLGDPAHLRVVPAPIFISDQLAFEVTRIQPRQARSPRAVAASFEPVAGETGVGRAGGRAAQRDHLATLREPVCRGRGGVRAPREKGPGEKEGREVAHCLGATRRAMPGFRAASAIMLALLACACNPPPEPEQFVAGANPAAGKAAIERVGCSSCHAIPGVDWPKGKVGPALGGLSRRAMIAGRLPNQPDVLAAFIRNAPAFVPGSAMPAMPVTEQESRDIASYLYEQEER